MSPRTVSSVEAAEVTKLTAEATRSSRIAMLEVSYKHIRFKTVHKELQVDSGEASNGNAPAWKSRGRGPGNAEASSGAREVRIALILSGLVVYILAPAYGSRAPTLLTYLYVASQP